MSEYQGNLLDYNLIRTQVDKLTKETGNRQDYSFLSLVLMYLLKVDQFDVGDAIIDGSDDCGIDAVFIDTSTYESPTIYLFQSKYYLNPDKYNRLFEASAIDKITQSIDTLFLRPNIKRSYTNTKLNEKLIEYFKLQETVIPTFKIVFCSNSYPPSPQAQERLQHWMDERNNGQDNFEV